MMMMMMSHTKIQTENTFEIFVSIKSTIEIQFVINAWGSVKTAWSGSLAPSEILLPWECYKMNKWVNNKIQRCPLITLQSVEKT
jgi:hypothetical protein